MVPVIGGSILIAGGIVYFTVKLWVVYWVAREPINAGGVPTLDAIIVPPIAVVFGIAFISPGQPVWIYVPIWFALIAVATAGFFLASRLGSRRFS